MIANIQIDEKSFGDKILYKDLILHVQAGEKLGIIGRNGTGKTTLFQIMTGQDKDFAGSLQFSKNLIIVSSRQEHHGFDKKPVLLFILEDLPQYVSLKHIIDTYPETMGSNMKKLEEFGEAIEHFTALGYFEVEDQIRRSLSAYGLDTSQIDGDIGQLSGGQKRFVELVKVQHSNADLVLIDEPTNHMDYAAKALFLEWFRAAKSSVLVITHDRDVLQAVDRIVEVRDGKLLSFKGGYDDYLRSNTSKMTSEVNEYEVTQSRIANLQDDIVRFRRLKEKARNPGTIHRFKSLEIRAKKDLADLQLKDKPSFWIDRESAQGLSTKLGVAYQEHKAKNIKIRTTSSPSKSSRLLVEAHKATLGYFQPLFAAVSFQLREGERIRLHGRNGAGKTTLVSAILATADGTPIRSELYAGKIITEKDLKVGNYEQEIADNLLDISLAEAIERVYKAKDISISDQKIKQLLSDYLFNPNTDGVMPLRVLSGGQKARFQLIAMLANEPQVLILDEPTNHLDLPSIEEMEDALKQYHGAIIYISHDSYFTKNLPATEIVIAR